MILQSIFGPDGRRYSERPAAWVPPTERGRELALRYGLARFADAWAPRTWEASLGVLDLLDAGAPPSAASCAAPPRMRALDLGAWSWRYVGGLAAWIERAYPGREVELTGVELLGNRWLAGFTRPRGLAAHFARALEGRSPVAARYLTGDLRSQPASAAELVTWFFPFTHESVARAWGLSAAEAARTAETLVQGWSLLRPGGCFVMANQGGEEWETAAAALEAAGAKLLSERALEGSLHPAPYTIRLSAWTREASGAPTSSASSKMSPR
ncbi:MAG: hypothetical protein IT285_05340 [Bdellovibrionales bacterium]|nr:hypothetical protein [Bdellovibrionales bacterium]